MNKTLKAADDVRHLARMFESLGEVVSVLDRVGNIEQVENETIARVDKMRAEATAALATVDEAKDEAAKIKEAAELMRKEASVYASKIVNDATEKVKALAVKANEQLHNTGRAEQEKVDAAEARVIAANGAIALARAEFEELEAKIDKAKAKIAKMLEA